MNSIRCEAESRHDAELQKDIGPVYRKCEAEITYMYMIYLICIFSEVLKNTQDVIEEIILVKSVRHTLV